VPLRIERRHPERDIAHEVCELLVPCRRQRRRRTNIQVLIATTA
jgi:hypothetical protein